MCYTCEYYQAVACSVKINSNNLRFNNFFTNQNSNILNLTFITPILMIYYKFKTCSRFGLIAAAKAIREVKAGSEFICHYNFKFHEGQPWYQEMWRTKVDQDTPEGPFGHREHKKIPGQPISPMLTDSQFYKEFYNHALNVLNLEPLT